MNQALDTSASQLNPQSCTHDQTKAVVIMSTNTIRLHRVLRATPERIYRAFLDPDAKVKWLPPNGFTGKVHHLEAKVGGTYKMSFTNFTTGSSHSFGGEYRELTPHERIRYTDKFDDPNLPGEMETTIDLAKVSCGTELTIVQEGVPAVIPAEAATSAGRSRSSSSPSSSRLRSRISHRFSHNGHQGSQRFAILSVVFRCALCVRQHFS